MRKNLRVLLIEDSDNDTELVLMQLRDAGYDVEYDRVQTASAMSKALEENPERDIILSDYSLPQFSAPVALTVLKQTGLDIPFIIVSGTIGEERAVSTLREGARDFILKHDLRRLTPVIERELRESDARKLRNKVEQAFKASEQRYRMIVNTAREGIWLLDEKGNTEFVNKYLAEILKCHEQDILGRSFWDIVHPDQQADAKNFFQRMKSGETEQVEFRLKQDGTIIDTIISAASMLEEGKSFEGCLIMVTDVTERKRIETERVRLLEELKNAVSKRDEFLSIASHELKTPLTSLKLQTQLRQKTISRGDEGTLNLEKLKRMFDHDSRQIDRLTRLIDDMLDISRLNTGKLMLELESFDLSVLVKDVVEKHSSQLESVGSTVELEHCDSVYGLWDKFRIEQVFTNLLTNSIKYGRGRPISVMVKPIALDRVRLTINDQGIGIANENHDRIFQRFERAISSNKISGLGLGLYIAKEIVLMHEGSIWVESEIGKGSTFNVELPLKMKGGPHAN